MRTPAGVPGCLVSGALCPGLCGPGLALTICAGEGRLTHRSGAVGFMAMRTQGCQPSTVAVPAGLGGGTGWLGLMGQGQEEREVLPGVSCCDSVGFCPLACALLPARLACPGSSRHPAVPGPREEGVLSASPLLLPQSCPQSSWLLLGLAAPSHPCLGLGWVALTGPCVQSAGRGWSFLGPALLLQDRSVVSQAANPAGWGRASCMGRVGDTASEGLRVCSSDGPVRIITPGLTAVFSGSPGRPPICPACPYSAGCRGW